LISTWKTQNPNAASTSRSRVDDGMLQGTMEADDTNRVDDGMLQGTMEVDDINTPNYVNMEIGLRRGLTDYAISKGIQDEPDFAHMLFENACDSLAKSNRSTGNAHTSKGCVSQNRSKNPSKLTTRMGTRYGRTRLKWK
jgi:hypothetical protein